MNHIIYRIFHTMCQFFLMRVDNYEVFSEQFKHRQNISVAELDNMIITEDSTQEKQPQLLHQLSQDTVLHKSY